MGRKTRPRKGATVPARGYADDLPFEGITPKDFERLCCKFLAIVHKLKHGEYELVGRDGEAQRGVDIRVTIRREHEQKVLVAQCKRSR